MPEHLNRRVAKLEEKVSHLEHHNTPGQQKETREGPHQTSGEESTTAPRQLPLLPQIPSTPEDSPKTKDPWYKTLQGWVSVVQLIGIPFAIGYAVVTYLQWQDIRHNFLIDQRAWLSIDGFQLSHEIDETHPFEVLFHITNTGRTPALNASVQTSTTLSAHDPVRETFMPVETLSRMNISPGTSHVHSYADSRLFRSEELGYFRSKQLRAYFRIRLFYEDIFGRTHRTDYCGFYVFGNPFNGFGACSNPQRMD
jgi:hypothetical protein